MAPDTTETVLTHLGGTAGEVARTLMALRVQGVRNTVRLLNPVVRYAQAHITEAQSIDVIKGDTLRIVYPGGREEELLLPPAVQAFLAAFHRGEYPELEIVALL